MPRERLHKVLAAAGIASRRRCEELIAEGHVTVDGVEVRSMGVTVDPAVQDVRFDGERIQAETPVYYLVHKPTGYVCSNSDPHGKRTVVSMVRDRRQRRLFTVGRLDEESEGLIIVTNDGAFANQIAHPRYGVDKTYVLKLRGYLEQDSLDKARKGVWLSSGKTRPMYVRIDKRSKQYTQVTVTIKEGQNRQLRRVFAKLGHAVQRLTRVKIGPVTSKGIKKGGVRNLTPEEVKKLLEVSSKRK